MRVTSQIVKDDVENKMVFRISLHSDIRKGHALQVDVDPKASGIHSPRDIERAVGIAGGALAEKMAEEFSEEVDPSRAAAAAVYAFHDMCSKAGRVAH